MPQRRRRRERTLEEFLSWLLGPSSQRAADSAGDARALRKRIAWCWRIRPRIAPPDARRHTVMADGTYMGHGWCLIIAIDGQTGEVLDWQWCAHESKAAYLTLFSRLPALVLLQCLFDRFGSVFPQCGLMVFPGVVIVSR